MNSSRMKPIEVLWLEEEDQAAVRAVVQRDLGQPLGRATADEQPSLGLGVRVGVQRGHGGLGFGQGNPAASVE